MSHDLGRWRGCPAPKRDVLAGRRVRLEPLDAKRHGNALYDLSSASQNRDRFRWLFDEPPADRAAFDRWLERAAGSSDPLFHAVVDSSSARALGRQAFMRIDAGNGVAEIGHILWGPDMARRPAATEAFYLAARHIFEDLGYRRLEWKCNNENAPSKRAALRFGFVFEGLFRQHMVMKGRNRDTAWFAMTDRDWATAGEALRLWLGDANFTEDGEQLSRLGDIRARLNG